MPSTVRNLLEFLDVTYPAKTMAMGLHDENFIIQTSTIFDGSTHVTERQADGQTIAYSALSTYAVTH